MRLKKSFSLIEKTALNSSEKSAGMKRAGLVRCLWCLYCLSQNIHHNGYTTKGARKYKCCECGKYFNDLTGTIFENRRFFIEEMFYIIKEMETKSALQISEELGRDYDSVLNFIHKVHLLASEHSKKITLEGVIEVDDVYVHAGEKGKKKGNGIGRRRGLRKRGRGTWSRINLLS